MLYAGALHSPKQRGRTQHSRGRDAVKAEFGLVAVPRKYVKDWMLNLLILAFGHSINYGPFKPLLFRELTAREQMELATGEHDD